MRRAPGLLVAALLLSACGSEGGSGLTVDDVLTTQPVATPSEAGSPSVTTPDGVTVVEVGEAPVGLAAVGRDAWATLPDVGQVRLPDDTRIDVGSFPLRLVETPAGVWVSVIGDGVLTLLDPATGEVLERIKIRPGGSEPEGLAYDGSSLWLVDQSGDRVLRLDPSSGKTLDAFDVGHEPRLVTAGPSGVYVGAYTEGSVTRIADGRAVTRNAGSCLSPQGLAEAAGVVWVACTVDGQVVGLDAVTLKQVVELPDLDSADMVVADGDRVYVVGQQGPTVWTIDASSREVVGELVLDGGGPVTENVGAALVGRTLVVSHPDRKRLYEIPLDLLG